MQYLHTELMTYFRADAELTALVDINNIRNEPLERYEEESLPGIMFLVQPGGRLDPIMGDRTDRVEVAIVNKYGANSQEISELIRKKLRKFSTTAITFDGLKEKCIVISASEESTEHYVSSKEEGLSGYVHTFTFVWRER